MRYGVRLIVIGAIGIVLDLILMTLIVGQGGERRLTIAFFLGCAFVLLGVLRIAWVLVQNRRRMRGSNTE